MRADPVVKEEAAHDAWLLGVTRRAHGQYVPSCAGCRLVAQLVQTKAHQRKKPLRTGASLMMELSSAHSHSIVPHGFGVRS